MVNNLTLLTSVFQITDVIYKELQQNKCIYDGR